MNRRPARSPLTDHLDALMEQLRRQAPPALEAFEEDAIHKSRVATRRLKAAIELLAPVVDGAHSAPILSVTRKLRRRLGPLRDLDVMLHHLEALRSARHAEAVTWARLRLHERRLLERERSSRKSDLTKLISKLDGWAALREQVVQAEGEALELLLAESVQQRLAAFVEHAAGVSERLDTDTTLVTPAQDPHELRIAGKALRYTLELAAAVGQPLDRRLLGTFKRMQDLLGMWHDHVVLTEQILEQSMEAQLALHDPPLLQKLLDLARHTLRRAQAELQKFTRIWKEQGDSIAGRIREAFALQAVSGRQTDPGPRGSGESQVPAGRLEADPPVA